MFRHSYTIQILWSGLWEYHVVMFDSPNQVPTTTEYQEKLVWSLDCYKDQYPDKIQRVIEWKYHFVCHTYFLIV